MEATRPRLDLGFDGLNDFLKCIDALDEAKQLAAIVEAAIRACKLTAMAVIGITLRYYDPTAKASETIEEKKLRPIRRALVENFTSPSLATLIRAARSSYHLIREPAPEALRIFKTVLAESLTLGPIGTLLEDLERAFPPDPHRVRIAKKAQLKKPILEFVLPELAKYEARLAEIAELPISSFVDPNRPAVWKEALLSLVNVFAPISSLPFRVGIIERSRNEKFDVLLTSYRDGRSNPEVIQRDYQDVPADRFESQTLLLEQGQEKEALDITPFDLDPEESDDILLRTFRHTLEVVQD